MTSFRLSELPIPYRSAGASPLGTHEGTVTPPEPPTPPTPGHGTEYVSGLLVFEDDCYYTGDFSLAEQPEAFFAKQIGDEIVITLGGTDYASSISDRQDDSGSGWAFSDFYFAAPDGSGINSIYLSMSSEDGTTTYTGLTMDSSNSYPDGVTVTLSDPA